MTCLIKRQTESNSFMLSLEKPIRKFKTLIVE